MSDVLTLNFGAQRNEDYLRAWKFRPSGETSGQDMDGWSSALRINSAAGLTGGPLLNITQVPTVNGSVIDMDDAAAGNLSVFIAKEDIAALPGRAADIVPFAFNLLLTDETGNTRAGVSGQFIVEPGV